MTHRLIQALVNLSFDLDTLETPARPCHQSSAISLMLPLIHACRKLIKGQRKQHKDPQLQYSAHIGLLVLRLFCKFKRFMVPAR